MPYCNCFIVSNLENTQKQKRFSPQNREKSCFLWVKPGIPVPVDVIPVPVPDPTRPMRNLPDPTRTSGYGSGRVHPWVRVDPHRPYHIPRQRQNHPNTLILWSPEVPVGILEAANSQNVRLNPVGYRDMLIIYIYTSSSSEYKIRPPR